MATSNDECPQGIKNKKDIEMLEGKVAIMFEHLNEWMGKMDDKLDNLDKKIEELKKSIPQQINDAVDLKWKTGVYDVVKWLVILIIGGVVGVTVKMVLGA